MAELQGRTALVTGGGQGIGRGIALELAKAGANVVVTQRNLQAAAAVAAELNGMGCRALALRMDVRERGSVAECVKTVFARFPRVDILVNNAGIGQEWFGIETDLDTFDRCYGVNLRGVWTVTNAVLPCFRKHQGGKIINIASINGRKGIPELPAYAASKAALINLTQSLAVMLGPENINVNTVCPGPVWTAQQEQFLRLAVQRGQFELEDVNESKFFKPYINAIPLRRAASPEDIGHAVVFLASERARNITGQALNVDGGIVMN